MKCNAKCYISFKNLSVINNDDLFIFVTISVASFLTVCNISRSNILCNCPKTAIEKYLIAANLRYTLLLE